MSDGSASRADSSLEDSDDCSKPVSPMDFYQRAARNEQKLAGIDKGVNLVGQIVGCLQSFNSVSHTFNDDPEARQKINFDAIQPLIDLIQRHFAEQDTIKFVNKPGLETPLPHYVNHHVSTVNNVRKMLDTIWDYRRPMAETPTLYVDLEGSNLGRDGSFDLLQLFLPRANIIFLVYVHALGENAFNTAGRSIAKCTLRDIFESSSIIKAFWDCRGDCEALSSHHGICLNPAGVVDLQLLELATTDSPAKRKKVKSLESAVTIRLHLPRLEEEAWFESKTHGKQMAYSGANWREIQEKEIQVSRLKTRMDLATTVEESANAKAEYLRLQNEGGLELKKVDIWQECPLRAEMLNYAVGDVTVMPLLYRHLATHSRLTQERKQAVQAETARRVQDLRKESEEPMNLAPAGWADRDWCNKVSKNVVYVLPAITIAAKAPAAHHEADNTKVVATEAGAGNVEGGVTDDAHQTLEQGDESKEHTGGLCVRKDSGV